MEWRAEGVVLRVRRHGESAAVLEAFTEDHGRHAGVVRAATSRRLAPVLQPGTQVALTWRARLESHIGTYTVEPVRSRSAVLGDRAGLAALAAMTALLTFAAPERAPHPVLYRNSVALLDLLTATQAWPLAYLRWELLLLEEMGFGLDLSRCAVTGRREGLAYVSPRTGRAVSAEGAGAWRDRLLPLPACLGGAGPAGPGEVLAGLETTGHFLAKWLAPAAGDRPVPAARQRLIDVLAH